MFVVSGDALFREACAAASGLVSKTTISEMLDQVASDDAELAAFVRAETMKRVDEIKAEAKKEFEDRFYWVEDENGDATVTIKKLTPAEEPEILTIDKATAALEWRMAADYTADLSYDDSATASYDEGDLVYVEHRDEEVERDVELVVEIEVSYEPMEADSFEIIGISLTEPADGFGIETQDNYDWPYRGPQMFQGGRPPHDFLRDLVSTSVPKLWSRCDERTAPVGLGSKIRPGRPVEFAPS